MPRFSIKDLLIATTLIAIGVGMIGYALQHPVLHMAPFSWPAFFGFCGWFVGGGFIGAGVFAPFKRPLLGAFVGLTTQLTWPLLAILLT